MLEPNLVEIRNGVDNAAKEVGTRFDFKGTGAKVELKGKEKESTIEMTGDSDFQLDQLEAVLLDKMTKRKVEITYFDRERQGREARRRQGEEDLDGAQRHPQRPGQEDRRQDQGQQAEGAGQHPGRRGARHRQRQGHPAGNHRPAAQGDRRHPADLRQLPRLMNMRALLLSFLSAGALAAPQVSLNGSLGQSAALLVIDGQVRSVRVGQELQGVRLLEVSDGRAVVSVEGKRLELRLGAAPVAQGGGAGPSGSGSKIVLQADGGGHFMTIGSINGGTVRFMVDTGATAVSLSRTEADRLGLKYRNGRPISIQTANGTITGYLMTLDRVRIGDVEIGGVQATVADRDMPFVLLGNSFLSRFQMKRENDTLTLERRF